MKKKTLLLTLGSVLALSTATGCSNAETTSIPESETSETDTSTDHLLYGVLNVPYADFYYRELNNIEPEEDATTGQYDHENDDVYSGLLLSVLVDFGLSEIDVSFDGTTIQIAGDTGLTGAEYISRGTLATALFILVMYARILPRKSRFFRTLMSLRAPLAIMAAFLGYRFQEGIKIINLNFPFTLQFSVSTLSTELLYI